MAAYYNEIDPHAAAWLRELIAGGFIADGEVDERSVLDVFPSDLKGFTQHHFFAGIGGWSLALRLAGWPDDRPVWTGDHALANLSARQAKERGLMTSGTYGPPSTGSSIGCALQSSLESKLRALTASSGSILYVLTWRARVTPSGLPICALRASARRTSASDSTGVALPPVGWTTPTSRDWKDSGADIKPRVSATGTQSLRLDQLPRQVNLCGPLLTGYLAETGSRGQLNPAHSRWLMGYPRGWCDCAVMATLSSPKSRRASSKP